MHPLVFVLALSVTFTPGEAPGRGTAFAVPHSTTAETATREPGGRVSALGAVAYGWNAAGQRTSRTDVAGTTTYDFDEVGTLLGATLADGREVAYGLDPLGRRVERRVDGARTGGWIYVDGEVPIAQVDAAGVVEQLYFHAGGAVAGMRDADGTAYAFVTDARGSVRLVVRGSDGAVVQRLDYDAFGRVLSDTNPGFQPFGYAGGLYDPDTHLVRFGAREYDAETAQWMTPDPAGVAGGLNPYEYAGGDPIDFVDRSGEHPLVVAALGGGAFGAAWNLGSQLWSNGGRLTCVDWGDVGWAAVEGAAWAVGFELLAPIVGLGGGAAAAAGRGTAESALAGSGRGAAAAARGCFAAGTLVETSEGPVPIEDIDAGDRVLAVEEDTGEWGYYPVTATTQRPSSTLTLAVEDDEHGISETLVVTHGHPLYERHHGWTPAGELAPGDEVFTSRGGWARIGAGTWVEADQLVYNLTVDGARGYFVGEAGLWAHNLPCSLPVSEIATVARAAAEHSFANHVATRAEFLGIRTVSQLAEVAAEVMTSPSVVRGLSNGRTAYYSIATNVLVIHNTRAVATSTIFAPGRGASYFFFALR